MDKIKVIVENIQAIEKAEIEVEGFTAVVGRSNSGKSSLIRGMTAAISNKAPKTLFRTGTKKSKVVIEDESRNIKFEWTKGENSSPEYVIEGESYKGGKERPTQLVDWGFKEIKVNDQTLEVQFSKQHEYLFLINETGSFVADFISKITKVDVITGAVKDCESDLRKTNEEIKVVTDDLDEISADLSKFSDIDYYGKRIHELYQSKKQAAEENVKIGEIDKFIEQDSHLREVYSALRSIPEAPDAEFDMSQLRQISSWCEEIEHGKKNYTAARQVDTCLVPELDFDLQTLRDVEEYLELDGMVNKVIPEVPEVMFDFADLKEIQANMLLLESLKEESLKCDTQLLELKSKCEKLDAELIEVETALGKCPMCKKGFNHEHIHSDHRGRLTPSGENASIEA